MPLGTNASGPRVTVRATAAIKVWNCVARTTVTGSCCARAQAHRHTSRGKTAGDTVAAHDRDVDDMRRCGSIGQDLDHAAGAVQVDSAIAQPMAGRMNHALGAVQCRLEASPGSKINTGTPAC